MASTTSTLLRVAVLASAGAAARAYDCDAELWDWENLWTPDWKAWCCTHEQKGCPSTTTVTTSTETQTSTSTRTQTQTTTTTTNPCLADCVVDGYNATCGARIRWVSKHDKVGEANPCEAAQAAVVEHGQCADLCAGCSAWKAECEGATPPPTPSPTPAPSTPRPATSTKAPTTAAASTTEATPEATAASGASSPEDLQVEIEQQMVKLSADEARTSKKQASSTTKATTAPSTSEAPEATSTSKSSTTKATTAPSTSEAPEATSTSKSSTTAAPTAPPTTTPCRPTPWHACAAAATAPPATRATTAATTAPPTTQATTAATTAAPTTTLATTMQAPATEPPAPEGPPCDRQCVILGESSTCAGRMRWMAENQYDKERDPCMAAQIGMFTQCMEICDECTPEAAGCAAPTPLNEVMVKVEAQEARAPGSGLAASLGLLLGAIALPTAVVAGTTALRRHRRGGGARNAYMQTAPEVAGHYDEELLEAMVEA